MLYLSGCNVTRLAIIHLQVPFFVKKPSNFRDNCPVIEVFLSLNYQKAELLASRIVIIFANEPSMARLDLLGFMIKMRTCMMMLLLAMVRNERPSLLKRYGTHQGSLDSWIGRFPSSRP